MTIALLILHGLVGVALLGALTHQSLALLRGVAAPAAGSFMGRYLGTRASTFTPAIVALFVTELALGAIIYPAYRLGVRIPFEEMSLGWAVGAFELKEHFAGIGLAILPFYAFAWRAEALHGDRLAITILLTFIAWWDFLVGHVLNNIRGLE